MIFEPRYYQSNAITALYDYFASNKGNPLVAMPTGTGKAVVIAMFLEGVFRYWPNQKVLIVTHVKELVKQNYNKLMLYWPGAPAGINSAGLKQRDKHHPIIFAGIGSVAKHAKDFGHVDLLIIDEAHLVSPNEATQYQAFILALKMHNPHLKVIGFTATPYRLQHGSIIEGEGAIFTDIAYDLTSTESFNRLVSEGYLVPPIPRRTRTVIDLDGVHSRNGEYIPAELQQAVDKEEITIAAVREAINLAPDRKHWSVFCSGVDHAINTANIMNDMGVPTVAVHSRMSETERDNNIATFVRGEVRAICNNNILTTGHDFPWLDLILMLRPTQSPVLWVQMLGRGTRPFPGKKNCLVLDYAGNTRRLGPINDPVIPKRGRKGGNSEAPVKECPQCQCYNHISARKCEVCGAEFKITGAPLHVTASSELLVKGDIVEPEIMPVEYISYQVHQKKDRPPSIQVSYYDNVRRVNEFVCLEHEGYAQRKARLWWRGRAIQAFQRDHGREHTFTDPLPVIPETVGEAIKLIDSLPLPTHIKIVYSHPKFPEVIDYCFDGSSFGTQSPNDSLGPYAEVVQPRTKREPEPIYDDDIPF